jgi:hypothetical protein
VVDVQMNVSIMGLVYSFLFIGYGFFYQCQLRISSLHFT